MTDKTKRETSKRLDKIAAEAGFSEVVRLLPGVKGEFADRVMYSNGLEPPDRVVAVYEAETMKMIGKPYKPQQDKRKKFNNPISTPAHIFGQGVLQYRGKNKHNHVG